MRCGGNVTSYELTADPTRLTRLDTAVLPPRCNISLMSK
jgi:hypothetical protein